MVHIDIAGSRRAQIEQAIKEKRILHALQLQNGAPVPKASNFLAKLKDEMKSSQQNPEGLSQEQVQEESKMCSIHHNLGLPCQCNAMVNMMEMTADMSYYLDDLFEHIKKLEKKFPQPTE